ncbi:hypothetical protein F2P56_014964 [Juglans regia]|uniref:Uncharacterized protein n=2 Tax=Juglans regia TaxID=51240 RepID=A0A833XE73_JUGRE|nr:UPF0481 protein At3g47200-like [Juglans regia]KAF5464927.1 hypothetical protein F2P56_014964 [Juglans regia]
MDGDALSPRTAIATKLAGLSTTSNAEDQPCIFKVHKQLLNVNEKAYKPVLLAIGPYNDHLKVGQGIMEEHKLRYLKQMLERRKEHSLEDYMEALRKLEDRARKCYADAECISQKKDEFVGMMLLDGCFIIELFRKLEDKTLRDEHDPIFQMSWMLPEIARDLLLFENQLPYFVLTELFNRSESNQTPLPNPGDSEQISCEITPCCESSASIDQTVPTRLRDLAISFFFGLLPFRDWEVNGSSVYPAKKSTDQKVGDKVMNVEFKHLLDLIYTIIKRSIVHDMEVVDRAIERQEVGVKFNIEEIFKPLFGKLEKRKGYKKINKDAGSIPYGPKPIRNATELKEAGIKFQRAKQGTAFACIKFSNGVLEIPPLRIEDETETLLRNLIAYEQYSPHTDIDYVTDYACFMDDLINSPKDVELLGQNEIIENWLGDDEFASSMFNKLCHHVVSDYPPSTYQTSIDINNHCAKRRNVWMATLRHNYFNSPWASLSVLAAILLLGLTIIQTVFSIIN